MNQKPIVVPHSSITLADIYYVLFRQKWKIIVCAGIGFVAALSIYFTWKPLYRSDAKLLIRYVLDSKAINPVGNDSGVKSPDRAGENIINSELEILTSLDLARQVADTIGPEKILAKSGGKNDRDLAAVAIQRSLLVEVPRQSSVIRISFQHPDGTLVRPVLTQLIESYFKKHVEIHRAVGTFDEFLTQQKDELRSQLSTTEAELRDAKSNANIISLEDTKKEFVDQNSKIQQAILDSQAELAEHHASVSELARLLHANVKPSSTRTNDPPAPSDRVGEYKTICSLLDTLEKRELDQRLVYKPESSVLKETQVQIAAYRKLKAQIETENPGLLAPEIAGTKTSDSGSGQKVDLASEMARTVALEAKIQVLTNQLAAVQIRAHALAGKEAIITDLQRKRDREDTQFRYYSTSLEQAHVDEALGANKISNISKIQEPSPPFSNVAQLRKQLALILPSGLLIGIGLAFLLELGLDRSVRRPLEIEPRLKLPLILSIPLAGRNGHSHHLKAEVNDSPRLPAPGEALAEGEAIPKQNGKLEVAPWEPSHRLRPFYEALRDRLVMNFESRNLTHKPKLVAVTGCSRCAGVSTIAAGLAASLSETGDGNVLLVDMNLAQSAAHPFHKGRPTCGLDEALEGDTRGNAMVQENLYVVTESSNGDKLPRILPKRFTNLLPKLKASDYDYIIFDMPQIDQISVTPRLAAFMDMVLLVVESEKTDREVARRASTMLTEAKSNAGVILNKTRAYLPKWLPQEV